MIKTFNILDVIFITKSIRFEFIIQFDLMVTFLGNRKLITSIMKILKQFFIRYFNTLRMFFRLI